jgi:hypothetical protein
MISSNVGQGNRNLIQATLQWIADTGINGFGVLPAAEQVAAEHLCESAAVEDAINSVIAWRTTYAAGTGFASGLGGTMSMPLTVPAALAVSYALGANTAAAIAHLRGYDVQSDRVRTAVLLCLLGEAGEEVLKTAGITIGTKVCQNLIQQVPGKLLIEINKAIGFRLITKAGETGVVNLMQLVPIVGGVVGATFDGLFVNRCGQAAKALFPKCQTVACDPMEIYLRSLIICRSPE